jgi:AraC family transcriptional regulator, transcriptional activator FtrA
MVKKTIWIIGYILSFVLAVSLPGYVGFTKSMQLLMAPAPGALAATVVPRPSPSYDATKPTVAILLGNTLSEPTDVLGPYAIFAESGAYNVYAVASSRAVRTLTGGLDVVPQLSFAELAARLNGNPDIVVVPQIVDIRSPENLPAVDWVRHGRTQLFSWCTGAEVLAESGQIDGKSATAHWADIGWLEGDYPAVRWQRGMRYVDAGTVLTTGGLTAGIDGTLHLLVRRNGQAVATKVVQALHIPPSPFVANPQVTQYKFAPADSILLLNFAFHWPKRHTGVWLYDGIGELDLGSVVDVYAGSSTEQIYTVASTTSVVSRHGLQFVPRWQVGNLPTIDRLLIPGGDGAEQAANRLPAGLREAGVPVKKLQNDESPDYAYGAALEDLALQQDIPTAKFAAKRLEVRTPLHLVGQKWPIRVILAPLLAGCIALGCVFWLSRLVRRR